jgi:hypothetical protein
MREPGDTGLFGNVAFSHDLVHQIGGDADLNSNMTHRILLLLESHPMPVGGPRVDAFERTVRAILLRYLHNDAASVHAGQNIIPRFLLNYIVRFWRTMCVDFAWKAWTQSGKKWGIRNIKLRFPRKLLFVSGLLSVFDCGAAVDIEEAFERLRSRVLTSPLENLTQILTGLGLETSACKCLDVYNQFLNRMDDSEFREALEKLSPEQADGDPAFREMRDLSHEFQDSLTRIFFVEPTPLREFTTRYGVF